MRISGHQIGIRCAWYTSSMVTRSAAAVFQLVQDTIHSPVHCVKCMARKPHKPPQGRVVILIVCSLHYTGQDYTRLALTYMQADKQSRMVLQNISIVTVTWYSSCILALAETKT